MASSQLHGSQNFIWSTGDVLGQGATAAVYKARHKRTGELYAVKTFNHMSHMRPLQVQMREFEVLQKLNHENIVKLLSIEEEHNSRSRVIVMELCTGGSLYSILDAPENAYGLEEKDFLTVLHDVAEGMKHLRDQDIVHRDIKPGNIMKYIAEDGRPIYKLTDFGAARELQEEEPFMSLYGTEEYLHPDIYEKAVLQRPMGKQFTATVDLWSLGVTFFHIATGQLPFRPFGGRRNRETMHKITTKKETGVISGVQHTEGGDIEWSRELPSSCKLSRGAQLLVVPLLAGLLECQPSQMWTFEKFFFEVNLILQKHIVHVFSVYNFESLHIFIDKNESLAKFQELIAEQTEVRANNQLLVMDNTLFTNIVTPLQTVQTYPHTSSDYPIYMTLTEYADFVGVMPLTIPKFPVIGTSISLDNDYLIAKASCGVLYHTKYTMENLINIQQHIPKVVSVYTSILCREIERVRDYVIEFFSTCMETHKRSSWHSNSLHRQSQMLDLLASYCNGAEDVQRARQEIHVKNTKKETDTSELVESLQQKRSYIEEYYQSIIIKKSLAQKWRQNTKRCIEDRCLSKVEQILKSAMETMTAFRRDKHSRRLGYNEEQIHKFEKNKLSESCAKSTSIVYDHCYSNLKLVSEKFTDWFRLACETRSRLLRLEGQVSTLSEQHMAIAQKLDKEMNCYDKFMEDFICTLKPGPVKGMSLASAMEEDAPTSPRRRDSGRNNRGMMRKLSDDLASLKAESSEVKDLVQENTTLLKMLEDLSLPFDDGPPTNGDIPGV